MKHEGWDRLSDPFGLELDGTQRGQLDAYVALLRERAIPLGFVSASDEARLKGRHVEDSLRATQLVAPTDQSSYDLGSGAGLPGIPIAVACPWLHVTLVESRRTRAAFLELAVERLGLGTRVEVFAGPVDALAEPVSLCFARAFASPGRSWATAHPLLVAGGRLLYFAGEGFEASALSADVQIEVTASAALARSGPLVIMAWT